MDYIIHIMVLACLYATLATSLDLLVGHTGLLSLAHAAFFSLGAYTSALLAVKLGFSFLGAMLVGILVAAGVSLLVSLPSLRLYGDYFIISTFAFQIVLLNVANNWVDLTGGPLGIPGIPRPVLLGWVIQSRLAFLLLAGVLAGAAYFIVWRMVTSPFGRILNAIREDEVFVEALGKRTVQFKVVAFAVSGGLAASAGAVYAHYMSYIDPTNFTVMESILILSMVIIGGAGSPWGPLVGATVLVTLPEILRFVGFPSMVAANMRQITYGALLVIMMIFRPRGLVGRYGFGR
jgi:branched-chain amino acid transport system permease protein